MHETFSGNALGLGFLFFFRDWGGGGGVLFICFLHIRQTDSLMNRIITIADMSLIWITEKAKWAAAS